MCDLAREVSLGRQVDKCLLILLLLQQKAQFCLHSAMEMSFY